MTLLAMIYYLCYVAYGKELSGTRVHVYRQRREHNLTKRIITCRIRETTTPPTEWKKFSRSALRSGAYSMSMTTMRTTTTVMHHHQRLGRLRPSTTAKSIELASDGRPLAHRVCEQRRHSRQLVVLSNSQLLLRLAPSLYLCFAPPAASRPTY